MLVHDHYCKQMTVQYGMHCVVDRGKVVNGAAIERSPFVHSRTLYRPLGHPAGGPFTPLRPTTGDLPPLTHKKQDHHSSRSPETTTSRTTASSREAHHLTSIHHVDHHLKTLDRSRATNLQQLGVAHSRRHLLPARTTLRAVVQRPPRPR